MMMVRLFEMTFEECGHTQSVGRGFIECCERGRVGSMRYECIHCKKIRKAAKIVRTDRYCSDEEYRRDIARWNTLDRITLD